MDFDEIDWTLFNDDREESETTSRPPDFRATIRDGLVTIVNWAPWLLNGGGRASAWCATARRTASPSPTSG